MVQYAMQIVNMHGIEIDNKIFIERIEKLIEEKKVAEVKQYLIQLQKPCKVSLELIKNRMSLLKALIDSLNQKEADQCLTLLIKIIATTFTIDSSSHD